MGMLLGRARNGSAAAAFLRGAPGRGASRPPAEDGGAQPAAGLVRPAPARRLRAGRGRGGGAVRLPPFGLFGAPELPPSFCSASAADTNGKCLF